MKIPIHVRYRGGTYIAHAGSKTASCTACEEAAASAVAKKLGHKHFAIERGPYRGPDRYEFFVTMGPTQQMSLP